MLGLVVLVVAACGTSTTARHATTATTRAPTTTGTTTTGTSTTGTSTTGTTTTSAPSGTLPPLSLEGLPTPSDERCPGGLTLVAPANQASGMCLPTAFVGGGTDTACPAGSFMAMGPVLCLDATGVVSFVPPGPDTCSDPGGPCPSQRLPLPPQASVIPWAAIRFPTGTCPGGDGFGEANGTATCVPYAYLPGGTPADPNDDTACPAGSGVTIDRLTGTLCQQRAAPFDVVEPVPPIR